MKTNIVGRPGFFDLNAAILAVILWLKCNHRCSEMVSVCKVGQASRLHVGKMELLLLSKVVLFEFYLDGLLIHPSVSPPLSVSSFCLVSTSTVY